MHIPLHEIDRHINSTILARGLAYFENGRVIEQEEISPGLYEAIVAGTDSYTVRLQLNAGVIDDYSCDCPYDQGPVCKHIAAVACSLLQMEAQSETQDIAMKTQQRKVSKRKTVMKQIDDLLANLPHEEIHRFIREYADKDISFRRAFLSTFAHLNRNESKAMYARQIKSILRMAGDRHGFIDWRAVGAVGREINNIVNIARRHYEAHNYRSAILMCYAVMEELVEALQFADDSNGDIGGNIGAAYDLLMEISLQDPPHNIRADIFAYCLRAFEKGFFSGWDWHMGMLHIAVNMLETEEEATKLLTLLEKPQRSEYQEQEAQTITLQVLRKTRGEQEAQRYVEQHLSNATFREQAIESAMSSKEYDKAIELAQAGIRQDAEEKPGLALNWYEWLLKIALAQKDASKILKYARLLFLDTHRDSQGYYRILKNHVELGQWKSYVEELIEAIIGKGKWIDVEKVTQIYITEKWWGHLFELLKRNASLENVRRYEEYLAQDYAAELSDMYRQGILEYIERNVSRKHYTYACRFLRRMMRLGAKDQARTLINELRTQYPQRRALLEELERV